MDLAVMWNLFCSSDENDPTIWFTQARIGKQQSDDGKSNLAGIACWASFAVWKSIAGICLPSPASPSRLSGERHFFLARAWAIWSSLRQFRRRIATDDE